MRLDREDHTKLVGVTLIGSSTSYHSPSIRSDGNAAVFTIEVIGIGANTDFTVDVETKDLDQTDGEATGVSLYDSAFSSVGVVTAVGSGIKQLVRLEYTVGGLGTLRFVHFRWLELAWE